MKPSLKAAQPERRSAGKKHSCKYDQRERHSAGKWLSHKDLKDSEPIKSTF